MCRLIESKQTTNTYIGKMGETEEETKTAQLFPEIKR